MLFTEVLMKCVRMNACCGLMVFLSIVFVRLQGHRHRLRLWKQILTSG